MQLLDSANGAYAFACGNITHNGFIGVDMYANPTGTYLKLQNLLVKEQE